MRYVLALLLLAHSWYPRECCSDRDCKPVPCSELREEGRYMVYKKYQVSLEKVRVSQDELCHVCEGTTGAIFCVFVPRNSV